MIDEKNGKSCKGGKKKKKKRKMFHCVLKIFMWMELEIKRS